MSRCTLVIASASECGICCKALLVVSRPEKHHINASPFTHDPHQNLSEPGKAMFFTWGRVAEPWGSAILGAAIKLRLNVLLDCSEINQHWPCLSATFQCATNEMIAVWDVPWKWFVMDDVQTVLDNQFLTGFFLFLCFFFPPLGAFYPILIIEQTVRLKGCHWTVYKEREHLDYNNHHHLSPPYFQTSLGREDNIISPVQIKPYLYEANFKLNWLHWIIILTDHLLVVEVAVIFKGWKETIKAW